MITIQITSDPYKRKITYERVDGEQNVLLDSTNTNIPEKMQLLSKDYSDCFFPFKAYEIAELIWKTYATSSDPVCIRFRGTSEEYRELCAVCDILNKKNSKKPIDEQFAPLSYETAEDSGNRYKIYYGYYKSS